MVPLIGVFDRVRKKNLDHNKVLTNFIKKWPEQNENHNPDAVLLTGAAAAGVAGRLIAAASLYCTNGAPMLQYKTIGGMIGVYDLEVYEEQLGICRTRSVQFW